VALKIGLALLVILAVGLGFFWAAVYDAVTDAPRGVMDH